MTDQSDPFAVTRPDQCRISINTLMDHIGQTSCVPLYAHITMFQRRKCWSSLSLFFFFFLGIKTKKWPDKRFCSDLNSKPFFAPTQNNSNMYLFSAPSHHFATQLNTDQIRSLAGEIATRCWSQWNKSHSLTSDPWCHRTRCSLHRFGRGRRQPNARTSILMAKQCHCVLQFLQP